LPLLAAKVHVFYEYLVPMYSWDRILVLPAVTSRRCHRKEALF